MRLSNLLKSVAGTCPFCNHKASILSREHSQCRRTYDAGFQEMITLAADAARIHTFDEKTLRIALVDIAKRSYGNGTTVNQAPEEGFRQGVAQAMADGIITRDEEERLRAFRDRLALEDQGADPDSLTELDRAGADRVMLEARLASISVQDGNGHSPVHCERHDTDSGQTRISGLYGPPAVRFIRSSGQRAGIATFVQKTEHILNFSPVSGQNQGAILKGDFQLS